MSIDLGGGYTRMTEQTLDKSDIDTSFEQHRSRGVSQHVRSNVTLQAGGAPKSVKP